METFWNTIAAYNAGTWYWQAVLVVIAAVLTVLLYVRPTAAVRTAMKIYMAVLNLWVAAVYYMVYCEPREYHGMLALFWLLMSGMWIYDLVVQHASLERTGRHSRFALLMLVMPLLYPLCSLALGRAWPEMTAPVMPCSVAVFTVGLMLAFSERVNIVLAMLLCHWALIGLSKVYYFGIPEDYMLALSVVPALFIFLREYIAEEATTDTATKPSPRVLHGLLATLCVVVCGLFAYTMMQQGHLL